MRTKLGLAAVVLLGLQTSLFGQQPGDDSDWWSSLRRDDYATGLPIKKRTTSEDNFTVAGVMLGEKQFEEAAKAFGPADELSRGDAASGRQQLCYVSTSGEPIYLIFEVGEVEAGFYLFDKGPSWNGVEHCAKSPLINPTVSTKSGLHLGITRTQLETILGIPNATHTEEDLYWNEETIHLSPAELTRLRAANPNLSQKDFLENYESMDRSVYIKAKFENERLVFLNVLRNDVF